VTRPIFLHRPPSGARRAVRRTRRLAAPLLLSGAVALTTAGQQPPPAAERAAPPPPRTITVPPDASEAGMDARVKQQLAALADSDTFYFFRFEDRLDASGITFRHRVVDDAGKHYKAVHYDHGNGISAADVDGDGLHDLYLTTQLGRNELWRNLGGGKFEDVTERAGVGLADKISVTGSFGDYDNDGDPDLYVTTVKQGNHLFRNDGKGRFTDVTAEAGVGYVGHSSTPLWFDYDRDGDLDLFVTNVGVYTTDETGAGGYYVGVDNAFSGHLFPERTETSVLYENTGDGRFRDASRETGLVDGSWSGDASPVDLDGDGWIDLYVLNMQGDDHLWLNREGKFTEARAKHFPKSPWGAMGIEFFDFDRDGRLDLILTDMHSDMSETIGPEREKLKSRMQWSETTLQGGDDNVFGNAFWVSRGEGRFEEVSDRVGAENYWPWGVSVEDLNADGYEDVLITASMNYPFRYGLNSVLLNEGGERFADAETVLGVEPRAGGATTAEWFELDCGGADREHDLCEGQQGRLVVRGTLGTRSSVIFDLDRDGDVDVVTNEFNSPPQVLISDLAAQTEVRWLEVDLTGTRSNRDGLGALVTVIAGGLRQTEQHDGKSGYLSQSSLPLYFGLGAAEAVDRVEVLWPSGTRQVVERPGVNRRIEIAEPVEVEDVDVIEKGAGETRPAAGAEEPEEPEEAAPPAVR